MARSLALPEDAFTADDAAASGAPWRSLVLHHYTSELGCPGEGKFGMGAHKDRMSMLTIVANEPGSDGLEALDGEGNWFAVPPKPGALIVNVRASPVAATLVGNPWSMLLAPPLALLLLLAKADGGRHG
jgi:isopenicillin N synthase-like dioxygenase